MRYAAGKELLIRVSVRIKAQSFFFGWAIFFNQLVDSAILLLDSKFTNV